MFYLLYFVTKSCSLLYTCCVSAACIITTALTMTKSVIFVVAGTRYKRRGVDDEGNTANYVETEQVTLYVVGVYVTCVFHIAST